MKPKNSKKNVKHNVKNNNINRLNSNGFSMCIFENEISSIPFLTMKKVLIKKKPINNNSRLPTTIALA